MPSVYDLFSEEQQILRDIKARQPEMVEPQPSLSPAQLLERIGITVDFGHVVNGYLGLYPQDFIVEEIGYDGRISTIEPTPSRPAAPQPGRATLFADVVKTGLSTIEVKDALVTALGIDQELIGYAGIKDKVAVTSQKISIEGTVSEHLLQAHHDGFFVKNIRYGKGKIRKGVLRGNRFSILVRTPMTLGQGWLAATLAKFENGFYNFYYLQRFGAPRLISHDKGKLLLQQDYEGVVRQLLFEPGEQTLPAMVELRREAKRHNGNWPMIRQIFSKLPYTFRQERIILDHLAEHPDDFKGALLLIPDQIKLWIYAYASWLFNKHLSELITAGKPLPDQIPLLLHPQAGEVEFYRTALLEDEIGDIEQAVSALFGKSLQNPKNVISPRAPVKILEAKIVDHGVALCFELPPAVYATTFLAHIFALYRGLPVPDWVNQARVDVKAVLGTGSVAEVEKILGPYMVSQADIEGDNFN